MDMDGRPPEWFKSGRQSVDLYMDNARSMVDGWIDHYEEILLAILAGEVTTILNCPAEVTIRWTEREPKPPAELKRWATQQLARLRKKRY